MLYHVPGLNVVCDLPLLLTLVRLKCSHASGISVKDTDHVGVKEYM